MNENPSRPWRATASGYLTDPTGKTQGPHEYDGWAIFETNNSTAGVKLLDGAVSAPGAPTATLVAQAGNLSNGDYKYKVTFLTSDGETEVGTVSNTITAVAADHGKINLSAIPVSASGRVTSRKIYRTVHDGSTYKLLTTLSNNTATTYSDNTADGSLGATGPTANTTGQEIVRYTFAANGTSVASFPHSIKVTQFDAGAYLRAEVTSGAVQVTVFGR